MKICYALKLRVLEGNEAFIADKLYCMWKLKNSFCEQNANTLLHNNINNSISILLVIFLERRSGTVSQQADIFPFQCNLD